MANEQNGRSLPSDVTYSYAQIEVTLKTRESQGMLFRTISPMNEALLWIEVGMNKIENEMINLATITGGRLNESVIFSEIIEYFEDQITALAEEFDQQLTTLSTLESKVKVSIKTDIANPRMHQLEAKSPLMISFLGLVAQFDEILEQAARLNFAGVLDRRHRVELSREAERKLTRLGRLIIDTNIEATRRIKMTKAQAQKNKEQREKERTANNQRPNRRGRNPNRQARAAQPQSKQPVQPKSDPEKASGKTTEKGQAKTPTKPKKTNKKIESNKVSDQQQQVPSQSVNSDSAQKPQEDEKPAKPGDTQAA